MLLMVRCALGARCTDGAGLETDRRSLHLRGGDHALFQVALRCLYPTCIVLQNGPQSHQKAL
jgi:hypothetical protein